MTGARTPTVFVVDPDPEIQATLSILFSSVHIRARYFESGQACMQEQFGNWYGCLVVDVAAPGVAGAEFLKQQRLLGLEQPVIFLSDSGDVPTAVEAIRAGAWDYLEKPFNGQVLLDSVHAALEQARIGLARWTQRREIQTRFEALTPREWQVVVPMVQGMANREIAEHLRVSPKTIEVYRSRIMRKTRADNLCGLIRMAIRVGLLEQEQRKSTAPPDSLNRVSRARGSFE